MKITRLKLITTSVISLAIFLPTRPALAHCPLCTAGAGVIALGAYWMGVNGLTIGVLMGAFAMAMGLWVGKIIKKKIIPQQDLAMGIFSWITTLLPLKMLMSDYTSFYINWGGEYGSLFNRTYPINLFILGGTIGGVLIITAPYLSKEISRQRGQTIPYQGVTITFGLLLIAAVITQFIL